MPTPVDQGNFQLLRTKELDVLSMRASNLHFYSEELVEPAMQAPPQDVFSSLSACRWLAGPSSPDDTL